MLLSASIDGIWRQRNSLTLRGGGKGSLAQILPGGGLQLPCASESLGGLITTQPAGSCPVSRGKNLLFSQVSR